MAGRYKAFDGINYIVSDDFLAQIAKGGRYAAVARDNLDATIRALDGRDPKAVFGSMVEYDKIKFTDWQPDTCDCHVQYMWHRDHPAETRVHHPHASKRHCKHHGRHATHGNAKTHTEELWDENGSMMFAVDAAVQALNEDLPPLTPEAEELARTFGLERKDAVKHDDIVRRFNDKREPVVSHPRLQSKHHAKVRSDARQKRSVHFE